MTSAKIIAFFIGLLFAIAVVVLTGMLISFTGCAAFSPTTVYERQWDEATQSVITVETEMTPAWRYRP